MKFIVSQSSLLKALTAAGKCIGSSVLPILNSYLFTIDGNALSITGSDMSVFLTSSLSIEGGDFKKIIAIPKARLFDLIKDIPDQNISFEIEEHKSKTLTTISVTIIASVGEYKLPVEAGDDYPMIKMEDPVSFEIYAESLMVGIDKTVFAAYPDLSHALGGIHMGIDGKEINYTSSNKFILSTTSYDLEEELPKEAKILIPTKVLTVLRAISYNENIGVAISERAIRFNLNDSTVVCATLLENKFPDYKKFLPEGYTSHLVIDKQVLMGSTKRVSNFSVDKNNTMIAELTESALILSSSNDLGETAREELQIQYQGAPMSISLNGKNLVLCLSKLLSEEAHLSFGSEKTPVLLREDDTDLDGKKNVMLLMPIFFEEKEV